MDMTFQDLLAIKKLFFISGEDFEITKHFQKDSLTDQIRRSSRVFLLLWLKRTKKIYQNTFTVN
jgi:hypothetical protein